MIVSVAIDETQKSWLSFFSRKNRVPHFPLIILLFSSLWKYLNEDTFHLGTFSALL